MLYVCVHLPSCKYGSWMCVCIYLVVCVCVCVPLTVPPCRLYTWGWGVHGQLGNDSVEDVHLPSPVTLLAKKVRIRGSGGGGAVCVCVCVCVCMGPCWLPRIAEIMEKDQCH